MEKILANTISPTEEMLAYETLWAMEGKTLKSIATMFKEYPVLPTELLRISSDMFEIPALQTEVKKAIEVKHGFSVCVNGTFQYPQKLREARYPIELFYYKGDLELLNSPCVSVVGSRSCSDEGKRRAAKLVRGLVEADYTVVSGLALGVDTVALETTMDCGGKVVGVIGTPIDQYYPKENSELQDLIAKDHLLISQVPFYRYQTEHFRNRRIYFPQRNETMSALSEATIIIEAGETSGTLTQARAAIAQGRKLFILNSCFENKSLSWPKLYEEKGAIRVRDFEDIFSNLEGKVCA